MNNQNIVQVVSSDAASIILKSLSESGTHLIAEKAAGFLIPGDVISLDGDLGAGKTSFTRGLAIALGCESSITSPTFTLMIEHETKRGKMKLYHFDAYRLEDSVSFADAGLDEFFDRDDICVIEWGNLIEDILPDRTIIIHILRSRPDNECERFIHISWPKEDDHRFGLLKKSLLEDVV